VIRIVGRRLSDEFIICKKTENFERKNVFIKKDKRKVFPELFSLIRVAP